MPAYKDNRDGRWRYRKWILKPDGRKIRITGTPAIDTKVAAEAAERAHIDRVMHPERHAALVAAAATTNKREVPTLREFAKRFLLEYRPTDQKPTERYAKKNIVESHLIPHFGELRLDEIDQVAHVWLHRAWRFALQSVRSSTSSASRHPSVDASCSPARSRTS